MTRAVLVDDHALVREGLRTLLERAGVEVVGESADVADGLATVRSTDPDIVLLDLSLGQEDGVELARLLRAEGSAVRILVLSAHDGARHLRQALAAGADGYLVKTITLPELALAIERVVAGQTVIGEQFVGKLLDEGSAGALGGRPGLTAREQQVLELVAEGQANREVAEVLGISPRTVQKHLENLFKKTGVHDRTELVTFGFRNGLIG